MIKWRDIYKDRWTKEQLTQGQIDIGTNGLLNTWTNGETEDDD